MDWHGGKIVILRSKDFSDIWLQEIQSNQAEKPARIVVSATHVGIDNHCTQLMTCAVEQGASDALHATNLINKHFHYVYFMNLILSL